MRVRRSKRSGWLLGFLAIGAAACMDDPGRSLGPDDQDVLAGRVALHHSHGRFFSLSWVPRPDIGPHAVEFIYPSAYRRSGYGNCRAFQDGSFVIVPCSGPDGRPLPGDIVLETVGATNLAFGDGSATGTLHYLVTSINIADDWLFALALDPNDGTPNIVHEYAGEGPFVASSITCCRIGGLRNSGSTYGVLVTVSPGTGNRSPIASLPPILNVARNGVRTWTVAALDPDGDPLRFSLTNPAGFLGGSQPPAMSIDATTGEVSWNTDGLPLGLYWSNITIDELDGNGESKGFIQLDYLINLLTEAPDNDPPEFTSPAFCGSSVEATRGAPLVFTVTAEDPDVGDVVSLVAVGIPAGATFEPEPPGNPVSGEFSWTPGATQTGTFVVTFIATDQLGAQVICTILIEVEVDAIPTPGCPLVLSSPFTEAPFGVVTWNAHQRELHVAIMWQSNIVPKHPTTAFRPNADAIRLGNSFFTGTPAHPERIARDVDGDGNSDVIVRFAVGHAMAMGNLNPFATQITVWGMLLDGTIVCGIAPLQIIRGPAQF